MKVGVIGGNGVAATNLLCSMIEEKRTLKGAYRDAHHPEMIIFQATQVPSRSMYLEGRGPSFIPEYIQIATQLKSLGCDIGCICCNTAHYAIDEIEKESGLKFINLIKETAWKCKEQKLSEFELFCSDGCAKFKIYDKIFEQICPHVKIIYPSEERQALVTKVICNVKNKNRFEKGEDNPAQVLDYLLSTAKSPVILGCTDLRVAASSMQNVAIDTLELLADTIEKMA